MASQFDLPPMPTMNVVNLTLADLRADGPQSTITNLLQMPRERIRGALPSNPVAQMDGTGCSSRFTTKATRDLKQNEPNYGLTLGPEACA